MVSRPVSGSMGVTTEVDHRHFGPRLPQVGWHLALEPRLPRTARVGGQIVGTLGPDLGRKSRRAGADEHLVRQTLQDLPGDADRMKKSLQRSDRAGAQRRAVHDGAIEFDLAQEIGPAAASDRTHALVGFDDADAGLDGVQRRRPQPEQMRALADPSRPIGVRQHNHHALTCRGGTDWIQNPLGY